MNREMGYIIVIKCDATMSGGEKAHNNTKRCGFPSAIVAEQSNDLTLFNRKGDILKDMLMN